MACKIIYKGKALPEEEAKIEINNDVVDDLNEQAVGKSIINSALLTDEEINQQITDLNKFKTVIENNYFKLEDNISVSSLVINKHIKNAPASLGKVKIDSKWRTKEEAKKQVEENLKQRKLFSKLKRNFGITEEQLNLIENVPADKAISSAEDLINAIESKLLSLNSLVLNSKKSKSATLQQKEQAKTIEQLFNENPELANSVYEALGFNNKVSSKVELKHKIAHVYDIIYNGKRIGNFELPLDLEGSLVLIGDVEIDEEYRGKGLGVETYKAAINLSNKPIISLLATDEANRVWESLVKRGLAEKTENGYKSVKPQITPEQKQQAQQLYSQYLNSLNKPNTNPILQNNLQEQQKKFTELQERLNNKEFLEGAKNAFESSEELQNVYYEVAGFNKPLDFYEGDTLKIDDKTYTISEKISSKELAKRNGLTISSNVPVYIVNEPLGLRKGGYDTVNNIIILSKNSDKETIQHELIHSVEYNLDKKEIEPLYQKVKNTITEDSFNGFVSWNFKKSISEFIADALSKKVFRDALKKEGLLEEIDNTLSVYSQQLTPQQKQDALNAYTDYIARVSLGIIKNPSSGEYNYESQVKDIVYHGSPNKEIQSFLSPEKEGYQKQETTTTGVAGIYFSNKKEVADLYQDFKKEGIKGKTYSAVINTKRPLVVGDKATDGFTEGTFGVSALWNIQKGVLQGLRKAGIDAIKTGEYASKTSAVGENIEIAVFEPEQIHILSSKADIQGFKEFVQGKQFQKLTAEEKARTMEQITKEHRSIAALKDLAHKLAHRIGGKVEFVNRSDVDWKGYRKGTTFVLNEAYMTSDTPFHEFSHIFIEAIKQNKPELYNNLLKELETSETGRKVFEQVKRDYVNKEFKDFDDIVDISKDFKIVPDAGDTDKGKYYLTNDDGENFGNYNLEEIVNKFPEYFKPTAYTLEEQQEEAIVQIIGLYSAEKLDKLKDKTLIQLIKELLKEISDFVKLIFKKEINITKDLDNISELTDTELNKLLRNGEITKEC